MASTLYLDMEMNEHTPFRQEDDGNFRRCDFAVPLALTQSLIWFMDLALMKQASLGCWSGAERMSRPGLGMITWESWPVHLSAMQIWPPVGSSNLRSRRVCHPSQQSCFESMARSRPRQSLNVRGGNFQSNRTYTHRKKRA